MVGPTGFHVDEPQGPRWQVALELLSAPEAETVLYREIGLRRGRSRTGRPDAEAFTAMVQSSWGMNRVTETSAREDLDRARSTLESLREASPEFDAIVGNRGIEYLLLDDYGMGAVHLAVLDAAGFALSRAEFRGD